MNVIWLSYSMQLVLKIACDKCVLCILNIVSVRVLVVL